MLLFISLYIKKTMKHSLIKPKQGIFLNQDPIAAKST